MADSASGSASAPSSDFYTAAGFRKWVVENKIKAVGSLWASAVGGSILYNLRKPGEKMSVKIIHARLHAQALTLAALLAAGAVEYYEHSSGAKVEKRVPGLPSCSAVSALPCAAGWVPATVSRQQPSPALAHLARARHSPSPPIRRREYERSKQYVFVAATMPTGTKKSVGEVLAKQFPAAVWVSGVLLHRHNPLSVPITALHTCTPTHTQRLVRLDWHQVDDSSRAAALLRALACGNGQLEGGVESGANGVPSAEQQDSIQRTMVFANDVESVDAIGRLLQRHLSSSAAATSAVVADDMAVGGAADVAAERGADVAWCAVYHKDVPLDERERALRRFQEGGGVLVCIDAASRGIDVEHVSHVVQAEFALNAPGRDGQTMAKSTLLQIQS
ncbi:unnamed protein product [Closterium sp. Naga37s-1]|nr:unnamed protein product [Closterium sp. Naga37s-1]